jgi:hypothetical protein
MPATAIGVPKNENGVEMLPAAIEWKINDRQKKRNSCSFRQKDCIAPATE